MNLLLRLNKRIKDIFSREQAKEVELIINDFRKLSLNKFRSKYWYSLELDEYGWIDSFYDIKTLNGNKNYKENYLELLICWIMLIKKLGFLVEGIGLQDSNFIIENINYVLESNNLSDFSIADKFGQDVLSLSSIQSANHQLQENKSGVQFVRFELFNSVNTYYCLLFNDKLADELINSYTNELFSLRKISCEDYVCSFYFDETLIKNNSYFKYKPQIELEIKSEIQYLLRQGITVFWIPCFCEISLIVLKLFGSICKKHEGIKLKCFFLKNYNTTEIKKLLSSCKCQYIRLKDNTDRCMHCCNKKIFKSSIYVGYFGYVEGFGVVRKSIINSD